jgi:hypothetical protein
MCTAPTTSAIMRAVSDDKQGVASAVNDTSREMGGALGIAVAGSILAGRYSHELAPRIADFPATVRGSATDSLAKAVEVAGKLGPQGSQLAEVSKAAFLTAMQASTMVMAVIVTVAAVLIGLWAPGRDGRQLRVVRGVLSADGRSPGGAPTQPGSLNEFGGSVPEHHDGRVRSAAGDHGQDRTVYHP